MDGYFKQTILGFNITIEKSTSNVPRDGRYYVILKNNKDMLNRQRADQLSRAYDAFWDNSYKFRKGGRLNKR